MPQTLRARIRDRLDRLFPAEPLLTQNPGFYFEPKALEGADIFVDGGVVYRVERGIGLTRLESPNSVYEVEASPDAIKAFLPLTNVGVSYRNRETDRPDVKTIPEMWPQKICAEFILNPYNHWQEQPVLPDRDMISRLMGTSLGRVGYSGDVKAFEPTFLPRRIARIDKSLERGKKIYELHLRSAQVDFGAAKRVIVDTDKRIIRGNHFDIGIAVEKVAKDLKYSYRPGLVDESEAFPGY